MIVPNECHNNGARSQFTAKSIRKLAEVPHFVEEFIKCKYGYHFLNAAAMGKRFSSQYC
jgi:hypothetical protein